MNLPFIYSQNPTVSIIREALFEVQEACSWCSSLQSKRCPCACRQNQQKTQAMAVYYSVFRKVTLVVL